MEGWAREERGKRGGGGGKGRGGEEEEGEWGKRREVKGRVIPDIDIDTDRSEEDDVIILN